MTLAAHVRNGNLAAPAPPSVLAEFVKPADVVFNGERPWDIRVHNADAYHQIMRRGSLGFGESYVNGDWDSEQLDETFTRLLKADLNHKLAGLARLKFAVERVRSYLLNLQSRSRAFQVGEQHYDIGNEVFEAMLDRTMSYSCGYWKDTGTLEQAQLAKLRLICEKLQLEAGQRLLDIGCGWGGLARYAAKNYAVEVYGITVSRQQAALAKERCGGLPVNIELRDYRELQGRFDRVVSVGMFEHVGVKNYSTYFDMVDKVLDPQGLFLLHTIGDHKSTGIGDAWLDKYIFPNGSLPSASHITAAFEDQWVLLDWHNFGPDYSRTLKAWWENFENAWPRLRDRYGERFYRMWKYYLLSFIGFFNSNQGQLWQMVFCKRGRQALYRSIR